MNNIKITIEMKYVVKFIICIGISSGARAEIFNRNIPSSVEMDFPYVHIPEKCLNMNYGVFKPYECCLLPRLFDEETINKCFSEKSNLTKENVFINNIDNCAERKCLLNTHNMLETNSTIDSDALAYFLDVYWVESNPAFAEAIEVIKQKCGEIKQPTFSDSCIADKLLNCYYSIMLSICPVWYSTPSCKEYKDYIKDCKRFIPRR